MIFLFLFCFVFLGLMLLQILSLFHSSVLPTLNKTSSASPTYLSLCFTFSPAGIYPPLLRCSFPPPWLSDRCYFTLNIFPFFLSAQHICLCLLLCLWLFCSCYLFIFCFSIQKYFFRSCFLPTWTCPAQTFSLQLTVGPGFVISVPVSCVSLKLRQFENWCVFVCVYLKDFLHSWWKCQNELIEFV